MRRAHTSYLDSESRAQGASPASLIRRLLALTRYEEHLRKTQEDADSRWQNVQELINFASEMEGELSSAGFDIDVEVEGGLPEEDDWEVQEEDEYDEEELDDLGFVEVAPKEKPASKPTPADAAA